MLKIVFVVLALSGTPKVKGTNAFAGSVVTLFHHRVVWFVSPTI